MLVEAAPQTVQTVHPIAAGDTGRFAPSTWACPTPTLDRRDEAGAPERFDADVRSGEAGVLETGQGQVMDRAIEGIHEPNIGRTFVIDNRVV